MNEATKSPPYLLWPIYAFATAAVASIAAENILIWLAVALFLFFQIKNHQKFDWPTGPFPLATLLFLASFFAAALWGIDTANSFHTVHKYLTILLVFLVGAMPLALKDIQKFLLLLNVGGAFCALHGLWLHFGRHQDRIDSFSGDKMVFGGMLMLCLLIQILFLKNQPKNWAHWLLLVLIAWGLVLTETRGAWLGFALGFVLLSWKFNRKWLLAVAAVSLLAFFFLPAELKNRVRSIWDVRISISNGWVQSSNYNERPLIWQSGWNIIKDYPMGIGQGNLGYLYPKYKNPQASESTVPHLHNNYLQILAQNGWIGFAAYLFWILSYYWTALRFKSENQGIKDLNWIFLSLFSATLVWGLTEYTFSHQYMNIFYFLLGLQLNLWRNSGEDSGIKKGL
jgi:O-antigen ligase